MGIILTAEVEKFVFALEKQTIAKTLRTMDLLEEYGFKLSMPHSKKVASNIFELRVRGKQEVRIFYCYYKNQAYLLHGFVKKSQKIPKNELTKALTKYKELLS